MEDHPEVERTKPDLVILGRVLGGSCPERLMNGPCAPRSTTPAYTGGRGEGPHGSRRREDTGSVYGDGRVGLRDRGSYCIVCGKSTGGERCLSLEAITDPDQ